MELISGDKRVFTNGLALVATHESPQMVQHYGFN